MSARILIVDDDASGRYVKGRILLKAGHEVIEATTGRNALDRVAGGDIDLVILDVRLPDMSGFDVCRQIKQDHPDVLVLQTSAAFTTSKDRAAGLSGGADSYLVEPVEPDELVATVSALLRMHEAEQQLRRLNQALEQKVADRTGELAVADRRLQAEMAERRKAEEELRQAQKLEALGQLTGGVAHDFNNLLTVISGNLELIERTAEGDAPVAKDRLLRHIRSAQRATGRAGELTSKLLAFSRRKPLRADTIELNRVLRDFGAFFKQAIGETIALEYRLGSNLWPCRLDPSQLETALLNLAVNARDAMPEGGVLAIETRNLAVASGQPGAPSQLTPGDYVVLSVADTGTGMDEATRERAFEPFFTTKPVGKGSGLGLSQVYGFVKQSGGGIRLESDPGKGARFTLYLPRADLAA